MASAALVACGPEGGGEATTGGETARVHAEAPGECALDPRSGALIGKVVATATDPDTERPAYRVQMAGDPADTQLVETGVRVVPCEPVQAEQREANPEPVP